MDWGFIWIMFILKLPLFALLYIIWWAIRDAPDPAQAEDQEGGSKDPRLPRPAGPTAPRRGPHGEPAVPPPSRARTTTGRSRVYSE